VCPVVLDLFGETFTVIQEALQLLPVLEREVADGEEVM
jgi:hypothetical protein